MHKSFGQGNSLEISKKNGYILPMILAKWKMVVFYKSKNTLNKKLKHQSLL